MNFTIALTPGDFNGIGPEVILKSLHVPPGVQLVLVSPPGWIEAYAEITRQANPFSHSFPSTEQYCFWWPKNDNYAVSQPDIELGKIGPITGQLSMLCVKHAVSMCLSGQAQAMVTAPISKEAVSLGGYTFPGHTEFLASLTKCENYTMMLVSEQLRVGLLTTHIPVNQIAQQITVLSILNKLQIMHSALKDRFSIENPRIAVLGLNPHAGDGGVIGQEEQTVIRPAIEQAIAAGIICDGPYPADGWFGSAAYKNTDAVLAMYHDQGLAPFKAISFGGGVNFTAGLPIIRTSPDHGTAFAIAGKNKANNQSMIEAIQLAIQMASNK